MASLLPGDAHFRILPFIHDNVVLHVLGPFQRGEDTVDSITTDIVICLVILPKLRDMELVLVRLIGVSLVTASQSDENPIES